MVKGPVGSSTMTSVTVGAGVASVSSGTGVGVGKGVGAGGGGSGVGVGIIGIGVGMGKADVGVASMVCGAVPLGSPPQAASSNADASKTIHSFFIKTAPPYLILLDYQMTPSK
jgi:hypothetical protein